MAMFVALRLHWKTYLIEAWALGMFMISACVFVILLEHPASPVQHSIQSPFIRRLLIGMAMGVTAVLLIYSPWGKRSGAHMNPAVTLANLQMERISLENAIWYIIAQCIGGALGVYLFKWIVPELISVAAVNYVVTVPGEAGFAIAFIAEFGISFLLLLVILIASNSKHAKYTGIIAGTMVALYITFEAPFSGMSINPARTLASALPSGMWTAWWIYLIAPVVGMLLAGALYRKWYRVRHDGNCLTMKCHLSGHQHQNTTYEVLGPQELLNPEPGGLTK